MKKKNITMIVTLLMIVLFLSSCLNRKVIDLDQLKLPEKGEEVIVMTTGLGTITS